MKERFEKIFELPRNLYTLGAPMLISAGALLKDTQTGKIIAQLKFKNLCAAKIKAVRVRVHAFNTAGEALQTHAEKDYLDLNIGCGEEFGQKTPVFVSDLTARSFSLEVLQVVFGEKDVWDGSGKDWEPLPSPAPLTEALADAELVKQFQLEYGRESCVMPHSFGDVWLCCCGSWNKEPDCCRCGNKRDVLKLDLKALEKAKTERLEREQQAEREAKEAERKRAELRKKQITKALIITSVIALAAFAVYGVIWHLVPNMRYNNASSAYEAGDFDKAAEVFAKLDDFKDSEKMVKESAYQKALLLMNGGEYREAAAEFERISDYRDSAELNAACIIGARYADAAALMEAGQYPEARKAFLELGEYKDSKAMADEAAYSEAGELFAAGKYQEAYLLYKSIADYKDSQELGKEAAYCQATESLEAGNYAEAQELFAELGEYKDSKAMADEATYSEAGELFAAGKYQEAYLLYKSITDYKDSQELIKEAAYCQATESLEAENYAQARELFTEIAGYRDSKAKVDEAMLGLEYAKAIQLLEAEKYAEAYKAFKALGDYKDSAEYLEKCSIKKVLLSESYPSGKKTCEYADGLLVRESVETWGTDGGISMNGFLFKSGDKGVSEYKYDGNGNCVEIRVYNTDGDLCNLISKEYDSRGNVVKESRHSPLHNQEITYVSTYDDNGNRIQQLWYRNLTGTGENYYRHISEYDEHNQPVYKSSEYDWGEKIIVRIENHYNEKGQLIKQVSRNTSRLNNDTQVNTVEYEYDTAGNRVWELVDNHRENRYEYDEQGNVLKATYNIGQTNEYSVTYTYGEIPFDYE